MTSKRSDPALDRLWLQSDVWERANSNDAQLLSEETDKSWGLIQRANDRAKEDPAASFRLYLEAAEAGSVWSMERIGWHYWSGTGVGADPDLALKYYHRAIIAGSWMATISYARLLAELGHQDDCERTLKEAVASGFVPAYFWLGWSRYALSRTTQTCKAVRPLIRHAAKKGHPGAKVILARWMAFGHLGFHHIPLGWMSLVQFAVRAAFAERREASV